MFRDGDDDFSFETMNFSMDDTRHINNANYPPQNFQHIQPNQIHPNQPVNPNQPVYPNQPLEDNPACFLQTGCPLVDMEDLFSFGYALNSTTVGDLFTPPPQETVNLLSLTTSMTSDLESSCGPSCKIPRRKKTNKAWYLLSVV
jgi:hypothetical protein